jgi:hypothetical protein
LLGGDAGELALPPAEAARLGLPPQTPYREALDLVTASGDKALARDFTRAVLALRQDPRVQGEELTLDTPNVP